jgi:hypothetical protein
LNDNGNKKAGKDEVQSHIHVNRSVKAAVFWVVTLYGIDILEKYAVSSSRVKCSIVRIRSGNTDGFIKGRRQAGASDPTGRVERSSETKTGHLLWYHQVYCTRGIKL